jgi:hypothetical protein
MGRYLSADQLDDVKPQAAAALADAPAQSSRYLSDEQAGVTDTPDAAPKRSPLVDQLGREIGLGGRMLLHGAGAIGGSIYDPIVGAINGAAGTKIPTMQQSADAWADLAHLPKPATSSEKLNDVIGSSVVGAAGFGGVLRGLSNVAGRFAPNVSRALSSSADALAANPAATVGGAATGAAAADKADDYAANHGFSPVARFATDLVAGTAGGVPGSAIASKLANGLPMVTRAGTLPGMAATPEQQQVIDAARRANVPLNAQDVGGPSGWWNAITKAASKAPFSGAIPKATAKAQTDAIKNALNATAEQHAPAGLGTQYGTVDQLLAGDLRSQYAGAKRNVSTAFDTVENALAQNPGAEQIQLPRTRTAAQQLLSEYPNVFDDLNTDASARAAVRSVIGGTDTKNSPILQQNGTPFQNPPTITYQDARALSKSLGQMMAQSQKQSVSGTSNESQTAMITRLYRALNGDGLPGGGGDIGDWAANAPPGVGQAHYAALDAFKKQVLPFRNDPQMYKLVSTRTPQTDYDLAAQGLYNNYFNSAQTERGPYALGLMSPNGQQAVTYQALRNAARKGATPTSPGVGVSQGLRALNEDNDVLASVLNETQGAGQSAADMRTLLNLGRSANDVMADPKNGNRLQGLQSIGTTAGAAAAASHFLDSSPAVVIPAALAGAAGLGNGINALSRYLPKSLIFATPGNRITNSVGPLFSVNGVLGDPAQGAPLDDDGTGLLPTINVR